MIEVFVESIRVNMTNYKRVVMLKEKDGERHVPIWVGHFEADAIAIPMQNVPVSRPLTHDFAASAIAALGGTVTQAVISELSDQTFYAKVVVENGHHVEIDSRPSDAIAVAIRAKVPIYVEDAVMEQAGRTFDIDAPTPARPDNGADTVDSLLESALGSAAAEQPRADDEPAAEAGLSPYLPGAEPAGGQPPEPFGQIESVTEPVRAALQWAIDEATRSQRMWIGPGDLMLGLLKEQRAAANGVLRALSVEADEVQTSIEQEIARDQPALFLTPAAKAVMARAFEEAALLEERTVSTEHLLLALAGRAGEQRGGRAGRPRGLGGGAPAPDRRTADAAPGSGRAAVSGAGRGG